MQLVQNLLLMQRIIIVNQIPWNSKNIRPQKSSPGPKAFSLPAPHLNCVIKGVNCDPSLPARDGQRVRYKTWLLFSQQFTPVTLSKALLQFCRGNTDKTRHLLPFNLRGFFPCPSSEYFFPWRRWYELINSDRSVKLQILHSIALSFCPY